MQKVPVLLPPTALLISFLSVKSKANVTKN